MQATRKKDTRELCVAIDEGGDGVLVPGPDEEVVTVTGLSAADVREKARRAAGGPAGRTVLGDDGEVEAEPAAPASATPLVDAIRRNRKRKGRGEQDPVTLEELAEAERAVRGG